MDFSKLTKEEILDSLAQKFPGYNFNNPYETAATYFHNINIGKQYPIPIADLYIAHELYKLGVNIPDNYNVYMLPSNDFLQLTKIFYLPPIDNFEIRDRAVRIIRILIDLERSPKYIEPPKIELIPSTFNGPNNYGDFSWMITRPEYKDALFIFDDNQEQFEAFAQYTTTGQHRGYVCSPGEGNAAIRPYQCLDPPRAVGIPTGIDTLGYKDLDTAAPYIDAAINYIRDLLLTGEYKQVIYSASSDGRTLRSPIYNPSPDVKAYIVGSLEKII